MNRLPPTYLPLLLVALAAWPVWSWLAGRAMDGSHDPVELLALATAVGLFLRQRPLPGPARPWQWGAAAVVMLVYTVSFDAAYPMIRAGLVLVALSLLLWHTRAAFALSLLLFLSLPVSATLQFYLGYPLRLVVAEASRWSLLGTGWEVERIGTALQWAGETILVDGPCSGLKMLWTGCFFAAALAYAKGLSAPRTVLLLLAGVAVLIGANIVRATLLFFKESGLATLPEWTHTGTGIATFAVAALTLLWLHRKLIPSV